MVEVCLALAPDINFFLNSRKQGLPCWRSLSFFLSNWRQIQKNFKLAAVQNQQTAKDPIQTLTTQLIRYDSFHAKQTYHSNHHSTDCL